MTKLGVNASFPSTGDSVLQWQCAESRCVVRTEGWRNEPPGHPETPCSGITSPSHCTSVTSVKLYQGIYFPLHTLSLSLLRYHGYVYLMTKLLHKNGVTKIKCHKSILVNLTYAYQKLLNYMMVYSVYAYIHTCLFSEAQNFSNLWFHASLVLKQHHWHRCWCPQRARLKF